MSFCHHLNRSEVNQDSILLYPFSCSQSSRWHYVLSKTRNCTCCLSMTRRFAMKSAFSVCLIAQRSGEDCTRFSKRPKLRSMLSGSKWLKKLNPKVIAPKSALLMAACIKQQARLGIKANEKLDVCLLSYATSTANQPGSRVAIVDGCKAIGSCCKGLSFLIPYQYLLLSGAMMKEKQQSPRQLSKSNAFRSQRSCWEIPPSVART